MLRALCFSGKPCVACDGGGGCGGGTVGVDVEGGAAPASHEFSGRASLGGGDGGGGGSLGADAVAIFLNFLWRYFPSDSSHRCSTGSMAGIFKLGDKRSFISNCGGVTQLKKQVIMSTRQC